MEFNRAYSRDEFLSFLRVNFLPEDFKQEISTVDNPVQFNYTQQVTRLGECDSLGLVVYEVRHSSKHDARVGLTKEAFRLLADEFCERALVFFVPQDDNSNYRFSLIEITLEQKDDSAKVSRRYSNPHRYSYYLGEGIGGYTPNQYLKKTGRVVDIEDLRNRFSVEPVSKDFFDEYREHYADIVEYITGKRYVKEKGKWVEKTIHEPCHEIFDQFAAVYKDPEKTVRDYIKKLMGRLVFLQFLQKKGWMGVPANRRDWTGGDARFLQNKFNEFADKDNFIDGFLEPLFNELNTNRQGKGDLASPKVGKDIKVPFLNGGLFQLDEEDCTDIRLPQHLLGDVLDFFERYNFTIDENDPNDAQIGVDPEMLGRVFENLLEDNKDKGAFYTPKEIVQYMCQESLIAYLQTGIDDETDKESIRQFVLTHEAEHLGSMAEDISIKLLNVKICDPAIGSGAFPMGLLRQLYLCQCAIHPELEEKNAADIKRHIIQNNIYGVDIEKGAVDIARLRFWLSLIVDEETPRFLPNLDFKIMQGNSLLEQYKGVDLSNMTTLSTEQGEGTQLTWFDKELDILRFDLREKLNEYYNCSDHQRKEQLKQEIIDNVKRQLREQSINVDFGDLDLSANDQFTLWHTWFYDVFSQGGFDIVIGNPPYISAPMQVANEQLVKQREQIITSKKFKSLYQKWDLYIPFIEIGTQLNRCDGITTMIVPFPLTNQLYAKVMRKMLVEENNMFELVDLNGTKIFDNATVSNCILFVRKSATKGKTWISSIDDKLEIRRTFEQMHTELVQDEKTYVWNVTQEKRETNRHADMHVLGDYCYISKGMVLNSHEDSNDEKFKKADLISETQDYVHCRKFLEGKDCGKYVANKIRFLEYDTERVPDKCSRPTFRELYLIPKLMFNRLGELQVFFDEKGDFTTSDAMFVCLKWDSLSKVDNKSIASSIKKFSSMSRSEMENLSQTVDLHYLLGIMNSRYASVLLTNLRGGDYHIYPEHIRNIPIPSASFEQQQSIIDLVNKILAAKKANPQADTSKWERKIDSLVYHLYGLTYDEVLIVDPETPITREEYEQS